MHDAKNRQLIASLAGALLLGGLHASPAAEPTPSPHDRLRSLQLRAVVTAGQPAGAQDWQAIDAAFDALVGEAPQDAQVLAARGAYRWERGRQEAAQSDWQAARRLDPREPTALSGLASAALEQGNPRAAVDLHQLIIEADPTNANAQFALANVLFIFRHELLSLQHTDAAAVLTKALEHFSAAARLAPTNPEYARAYAETFYSLPKPDWPAALEAWAKVRDLSPAKDFAWVNIARVQLRLGRPADAQQALQSVQDPAFQRIKARLQAQISAEATSTAKPQADPPLLPPGQNSPKPAIDDQAPAP